MNTIGHDIGADRPPGRRRGPLVLSAAGFAVVLTIGVALGGAWGHTPPTLAVQTAAHPAAARSAEPSGIDDDLATDGRRVFRQDTFGDQAFWGGVLQLHKAIEGEKLGGVGPGVSPKTALAVGL